MNSGLTSSLASAPLRTRIISGRDGGIVVDMPASAGSGPGRSGSAAFLLDAQKGSLDWNGTPNVRGAKRGKGAVDMQVSRGAVSARVASGAESVICGGCSNTASGNMSVVAGGFSNTASGSHAFVAGYNNNASAAYASILGGHTNTASASYASVSGGYFNTASATSATVCGGHNNTASANYATVGGGAYGVANRIIQFAIGGATAQAQWQNSKIFVRRNTTDATPTELSIDGADPTGTVITTSNRVIIAANTTLDCMIYITGQQKKTEDNGYASYIRRCVITRDNANNTTISAVATVGTDIETDAAWDVAVTADNTNEALVITVTGVAATSIRWFARIEANEITYA